MFENWSKGQKIALTVGMVFLAVSCLVFSVAAGFFFTQGGWEKAFGDDEQTATTDSADDDSSERERVTASAEEVAHIATYLPEDAGGYVWMERLERGMGGLGQNLELIRDASPDSESSQNLGENLREFRDTLGIDLADPSTWKDTGLDLKTPMGMALFLSGDQLGATMVMEVADADKFTALLKKASDEELEQNTTEGRDYYYSPDGEAVWTYEDDLVVLGTAKDGAYADHVEMAERSFEAAESSGSIDEDDGFQDFRTTVASRGGFSFYLPVDGPLADMAYEAFRREIDTSDTPLPAEYLDMVRREIEAAGWNMRADGPDRGRVRMWLGLSDTGQQVAEQLTTASTTYEWGNLVTDETLFATRIATRPAEIWSRAKKAMPAEQRQEMEQGMKMAGQMSGGNFDIEKDVIDKLGGQVGMVLYEVGDREAMKAVQGGNPSALFEELEALFVLQFVDEGAVEKVMSTVQTVVRQSGKSVDDEQLDGLAGATVYTFGAAVPLAVYQHENVLAVAPEPMASSQVAALLGGDESALDGFGQDFVDQPHVNGVFMNVSALQGSPGGQELKELDNMKATAVYSYVDDRGGWLEWEVQVDPEAKDGG